MSNFLFQQTRIANNSARQLLKKFNIEKYPVDSEKIAELLGIKVVRISFENNEIAGLMKRKGKDGDPVIVINETDIPERQRFTIAHEIGHFLLHKNDEVLIDVDQVNFRDENSSTAKDIKEIQANQFAAELLMPNFLLIEDLKKYISSGKNIVINLQELSLELSKKYNVSLQAMMIRISRLID